MSSKDNLRFFKENISKRSSQVEDVFFLQQHHGCGYHKKSVEDNSCFLTLTLPLLRFFMKTISKPVTLVEHKFCDRRRYQKQKGVASRGLHILRRMDPTLPLLSSASKTYEELVF